MVADDVPGAVLRLRPSDCLIAFRPRLAWVRGGSTTGTLCTASRGAALGA
jgi:hypothetical protein